MMITMDGRSLDVPENSTVLDAARGAGIDIPSLCSYPDHENGVCRLCMVQVDGNARMVPSCSLAVAENMSVETDTERLRDYRKNLLSLYMRDHPDHPGSGEEKCELHALAGRYGVHERMEATLTPAVDSSHPALLYDSSLCVQCRRCVIACDYDQRNDVIAITGRGYTSGIGFDLGVPMGDSSCLSCGSCADACPTGAIIEKGWEPAESSVVTTCPYCAVGCQIEYGVKDSNIIWARAAGNSDVNGGKLCVKGKFGFGFERSADRLTQPLIRKEGVQKGPLSGMPVEVAFRPASWDEAMNLLASRIRDTIHKYGNNAVAGIASDRSTNEDVYAFQKLMRAVLKTDNLDQSATLCHSPSAAMLSYALGAGASTNPMHDVFNSRTIMVVGSNTDRAHPVLSSYIKNAAAGGAFLIVVDPRRVDLARRADLFLQIRPGTDTYLFSAMASYIVENGLHNRKYIEANAEAFEEFLQSLPPYDPLAAEEITGISSSMIEEAARRYAASGPSSIFWTLGITEHENGSDNVSSLVNLSILTGNLGIPGGGVNPIRGQNNVQGGADVGGFPGSLPGYQDLRDPETRGKFMEAWKTDIPGVPGWKSTEMIDQAIDGNLHLMYISGENSIRTHPDSSLVDVALRNLDFLAVQEIFMTETAEYADLILPAASSFEKSGTFTNTERRVQLVRPVLEPPGEAKPDWAIYSDLASRLGYDMGFSDSSSIMEEIASLVPAWSGIRHSRLEGGGMQWPVTSLSHGGTSILHVEGAMRGKARFRPVGWKAREKDPEYPYTLITGREREHYHTATMTERSPVIRMVEKGPAIEMSPSDMKRHSISEGMEVRIVSPSGEITARVRASSDLPHGVVFTTFHYSGLRANLLTPSTLDPLTKTPAYKDTRVRIEKIG